MLDADRKPFAQMLATTFTVYGRPVPDSNAMHVWFRLLQEFDLHVVQLAFDHYVATEPKFPPTPAQIRESLGAGKGDSRPGADEAWAIALTSRDEAETVVWTPEIAEAFGVCRPVLDMGDEVGARMAFKDAYNRVIQAARLRNAPVQWVASIGFDADRREEVLRKAETAGLLPAPQVAALLPPPAGEMTPGQAEIARANTAKLKAMLADALAAKQAQAEARAQAERDRQAALKAESAAKVHAYEEAHGLRQLH